nr:phage protease [Pasteurella multocida]
MVCNRYKWCRCGCARKFKTQPPSNRLRTSNYSFTEKRQRSTERGLDGISLFHPQGIFADVRWTDKAAEYIKNGEYRYISAVFAYDTEGYVRKIFHAALTNTPALDGMDEAMVAASVQLLNEEAQEMDKELLAMLCSLFGVASATETEIKEKVTALSQAKGESKVVLSDVYSALKEKSNPLQH